MIDMIDTTLKTLATAFTHEIVIERSRFITHLFPTSTQEEAMEAIKQVNKLHYDATHNCTAYIIGNPIITQKTNDDGEPKGTAGMPMMQSLNFRNMTNITAVVTRYFGGIKLGAGGLIRAYSNAVTKALDHAPISVYQSFQILEVHIGYEELNTLYYIRDTAALFSILDIKYSDNIAVTLEILSQNTPKFKEQCLSQFMREVEITVIDECIRTALITDVIEAG